MAATWLAAGIHRPKAERQASWSRQVAPPLAVPAGIGAADCVSALTVALDAVLKAIGAREELQGPRVGKRIVLISDFSGQVRLGFGRAMVNAAGPLLSSV